MPNRRRTVNKRTVFQKPQVAKPIEPSFDRFTNVIFQAIRARFADAVFTRDDILTLVSQMRLNGDEPWAANSYGINDYATGTRYHKVRVAVQKLVSSKNLIALDWIRLCLPAISTRVKTEPTTQTTYLPTIRRLVHDHFPPSTPLDVMAVVDRWVSDQHVPENIKKMTVRGILPILQREGVLYRDKNRALIVSTLTNQQDKRTM